VSQDREIPAPGNVLQVDGEWQLENHNHDKGPVIRHNCDDENNGNTYIIDLNREFPMCRHCGADIPNSMISGFSLLNYNESTNDEYFVDPKYEVLDFVYNGHLRERWDKVIVVEEIDKEQVLAAIAEWKTEQELT
jgi:hypothetical protein